MKILAITQARIGSSRLPGKVLKRIHGETLLGLHLGRAARSQRIWKHKVAVADEPDAYKIVDICRTFGIEACLGSVNHVLDRFMHTAAPEKPDWVVRLTADCPLIDPEIIDEVVDLAIRGGYDYVSNALKPSYPDGMDVEIMRFEALERAVKEAILISDMEHVTPFIWRNSSYMGGKMFRSNCLVFPKDYSAFRLTVDTPEDFRMISLLVEREGSDRSWLEYVEALQQNPDIMAINAMYERNEGYSKSLENDTVV